MNLENLEKHIKEDCLYEKVLCPNFGCQEEMLRHYFS